MAEAGSFVTVSKTAAPFVPQTTSTPDDDEDQEEDLVDTVATATAAAATVAFDTASRIQEAMESGSIWDAEQAAVDFSGRIIQFADALAQKSLGGGMGCSHDPVELTTVGSLAFEATDVLSRTVEAAVDATYLICVESFYLSDGQVQSHFLTQTQEGAVSLVTAVPVVAQLQPNVVKLVTSAEKATADLGDSVAKAFTVDDNQVPESVLRRRGAAVALAQKRAAQAALDKRVTSPRPDNVPMPTSPTVLASPKAASAPMNQLAPTIPSSPVSPAARSVQLAETAEAKPTSPTATAGPAGSVTEAETEKAAIAADRQLPAEIASESLSDEASPPAAHTAATVRSAFNGASCFLTPLQQLAVASKTKIQSSMKDLSSWAGSLPSSGAAAVAALEKLKLSGQSFLTAPAPTDPAKGPARETEEVVTSLRDLGHEAAAIGDATSAVRFYTAGLNLAPDNHLLRYSRANALVKLGKTTDATRDALLLVRVMPVWSNGWGLCASLMEADGNAQEAIALYECAKQIAETNEEDDIAAQKYADAIERLQERQSQLDRP